MRTLLGRWESVVVWGLFFTTTVYGHVALKLATGDGARFEYGKAIRALTGFWGWSAILAWVISALLWAVVLTRESLLAANSVSSLRYVLVCVAAWIFLRENVQPQHGLGILLVTVGIWLCTR